MGRILVSFAPVCVLLLCAASAPPVAPPASQSTPPPSPASAQAAASAPAAAMRPFGGVSNVFPVAVGVYSGNAPDEDAAFEMLAAMNVKTIVSVDGAAPDTARAEAHGMRYVHIPIGYDGVTDAARLAIARAVRDLPGPVYVHCHHGKHRGPAAAAAAAITLGRLEPTVGVDLLKKAGTSPSYRGLYECVEHARAASSAELDAAPAEFPKRATVSGVVQSMVKIDEGFEHVSAIRAANWSVPANHPDLVPAAEAGRIGELLRGLRDEPRVQRKPAEFREMLGASADAAAALEAALLGKLSSDVLEIRYRALEQTCTACHAVYRNARRGAGP